MINMRSGAEDAVDGVYAAWKKDAPVTAAQINNSLWMTLESM